MAENSKIEWTTHTFNPWIGCQKVSPGCDHCYAEAMMDHRYGRVKWGPHGERVRTSAANWKKPLQWARQANGSRPRVFCASLADVFDNRAPAGARDDLFALIRSTPELDWLLLTKRPENIRKMLPNDWGTGYPNVWLGTTIENQEQAHRRVGLLLEIPAIVRFLSCEPLLERVDLTSLDPTGIQRQMKASGFNALWSGLGRRISWVICGGESGSGARHMDPDWSRDLRDQCAEQSVPFFMKQMTGKKPIPTDLLVRQFPQPTTGAE